MRKYYVNELIRGTILFTSLGLLYFIFTLFVEYFLWLKPVFRSLLFWTFIGVEFLLLVKFIVVPLAKIVGLKKGISFTDASKIIGNHFKEVDDKLLNVLQLKKSDEQSDLLIASIEQKAAELQLIPFKKAVDFKRNLKYVKYAAIPVFIWLLLLLTDNRAVFSDSLNRMVHYKTAYEPPAPFVFDINNKVLEVIEGEDFKLQISTEGTIVPEDIKIHYADESYLLQNDGLGNFEYTFLVVQKPVDFYLESNGYRSQLYSLRTIKAPVITNLEMNMNYPNYTKKPDIKVQNTGNAIVPEGTTVTWKISSKNTERLLFTEKGTKTVNKQFVEMKRKAVDEFVFSKLVKDNFDYEVSTSNESLKNYEKLQFSISVVKDEYPEIIVQSDVDSVTTGPVQFVGQVSDDYGVSKLQLVYFKDNKRAHKNKVFIPVNRSLFSDFYYVFPNEIDLEEGVNYELYFEVYDNDGIHGPKRSKSKSFSYYNKTKKEITEELLYEQQKNLDQISETIENSKSTNEALKKLQENLQHKRDLNWNDQKKLAKYLERQQQYKEMMERQTNQLLENLSQQEIDENEPLKSKKEMLSQRLEELKKLAKQEQLLKELEELAEKLDEEKLVDRLKKLTEQNKQKERSLERILELTKRFYVERKAEQLKGKLSELSKKQESLRKSDENTLEKQNQLNSVFEKIKEELKELDNKNRKLKKPMPFPDTKGESEKVSELMKKAAQNLKQNKVNHAKKNQRPAAHKIKKISEQLNNALSAMEGEMLEANLDDLRAILENLLEFSFQQEELIMVFSDIDDNHPEFSEGLKKQYQLQEYFEHIDDSLYVLAMKVPQISAVIQKDLASAHFFLDEALTHFTEDKFNIGVSDQQHVMTGANNLAVLLSDVFEKMSNPRIGSGSGKGDSFALPDVIQKQKGLMEEMKKKLGEQLKNGEGKSGSQESLDGELFEIYKQQTLLKQKVKEILGNNNKNKGEEVLKKMEDLEKELLEKGLTQLLLQKNSSLQHELLKLEKAMRAQGKGFKRKSTTNTKEFKRKSVKNIRFKKLQFNQNEILNRQSLPLQKIYKKKVQEYFKNN